MPTWREILIELKQMEENGVIPPFDAVRRKYMATTYNKTGRNTILYATKSSPNPNNLLNSNNIIL